MKVLTSLAEKDYFLGLAALVNSVIKHGKYVDKIVVGYRGKLPSWLPELKSSKNGKSCILNSGIEMEFILMEGSLHMVHEKPKWFKYLTEVLEPEATEFLFFDSDIVILKRMSFFGEWIQQGVALCEDVNYDMSVNHPIRLQWGKLAEKDGLKIANQINNYFNSGFLGWSRRNAEFVTDWDKCFTTLSRKSGDMNQFRVHDRTFAVLSANQDSLNLAAMITMQPISTIGPEAMGFRYGLRLMAHPVGNVKKPWKRRYLKDFLIGFPPSDADMVFWENVVGSELKPVSSGLVWRKKIICKLLRAGSRFYKRP